jgi:hypothetical protein
VDAHGIFEDECVIMKTDKKHDEDGLQYSGEKLLENHVQRAIIKMLEKRKRRN